LEASGAIVPEGNSKKELTPTQQKEVDDINASNAEVESAKQRTLMEHIAYIGLYEQQDVPDLITEKDVVPGRCTLANPDATLGHTNFAELGAFAICMQALFKNTPSWKRRQEDCIENVVEWQLWLLRNQWQELRKAQHESTKHKDIHEYTWGVMKLV